MRWKWSSDPRENPPTNGIIRHDSHLRKFGSDPAGDRTRFAMIGEGIGNGVISEKPGKPKLGWPGVESKPDPPESEFSAVKYFHDKHNAGQGTRGFQPCRPPACYSGSNRTSHAARCCPTLCLPSRVPAASQALDIKHTADTSRKRQPPSSAPLSPERMAGAGNNVRGLRHIPDKPRQPAASSGTIPSWEVTGVTRPGVKTWIVLVPQIAYSISRSRGRRKTAGGCVALTPLTRPRPGEPPQGQSAISPGARTQPTSLYTLEQYFRGQTNPFTTGVEVGRNKKNLKRFPEAVSLLASLVQSPAGSLPDFLTWESCRRTPLVGGFSQGSPVSLALSFRRCSILASHPSPSSALMTSCHTGHFSRDIGSILNSGLEFPHLGNVADISDGQWVSWGTAVPATYESHRLTKDEVDRSRWLRAANLRVPTLNCFSAYTSINNGVDWPINLFVKLLRPERPKTMGCDYLQSLALRGSGASLRLADLAARHALPLSPGRLVGHCRSVATPIACSRRIHVFQLEAAERAEVCRPRRKQEEDSTAINNGPPTQDVAGPKRPKALTKSHPVNSILDSINSGLTLLDSREIVKGEGGGMRASYMTVQGEKQRGEIRFPHGCRRGIASCRNHIAPTRTTRRPTANEIQDRLLLLHAAPGEATSRRPASSRGPSGGFLLTDHDRDLTVRIEWPAVPFRSAIQRLPRNQAQLVIHARSRDVLMSTNPAKSSRLGQWLPGGLRFDEGLARSASGKQPLRRHYDGENRWNTGTVTRSPDKQCGINVTSVEIPLENAVGTTSCSPIVIGQNFMRVLLDSSVSPVAGRRSICDASHVAAANHLPPGDRRRTGGGEVKVWLPPPPDLHPRVLNGRSWPVRATARINT
ncbi:hypothetical protein PR048_014873 [Dryococelus australis]|uniref:Uncharacterized protein n=1 Tax=Dryococelus australis TaxID=614101 RepID=A0ABQ9HFD1_9NEOP|nr:hypothetical protein PR048_014873 [Dryococelus australis]